MASEIQCMPYATRQHSNTVHSNILQPQKRNNRLSNRMAKAPITISAFAKTKSDPTHLIRHNLTRCMWMQFYVTEVGVDVDIKVAHFIIHMHEEASHAHQQSNQLLTWEVC